MRRDVVLRILRAHTAELRGFGVNSLHLFGSVARDDAADGSDVRFSACWGFVFNLPCYAGGLQFCPEAVATDGRLDVCTFQGGSLTDGIWYLGNLLMGRHRQLADCQMGQYTRIRLESAARVAYQLDGDPGGHLPLEIELESRRWTLIVPPRWLHRSGVPQSGRGQV